MRIEIARPPNYEAIVAAFPHVAKQHGVLFAWQDLIWNPDGIHVTPSLLCHEAVHSRQITEIGGPLIWWDKYLTDPAFRFLQEIPAHIEEYAYVYGHTAQRAHRRLYLSDIAARLAGPLYGSLTSKAAAIRLLKAGLIPSTQTQEA